MQYIQWTSFKVQPSLTCLTTLGLKQKDFFNFRNIIIINDIQLLIIKIKLKNKKTMAFKSNPGSLNNYFFVEKNDYYNPITILITFHGPFSAIIVSFIFHSYIYIIYIQ